MTQLTHKTSRYLSLETLRTGPEGTRYTSHKHLHVSNRTIGLAPLPWEQPSWLYELEARAQAERERQRALATRLGLLWADSGVGSRP